VNFVKPPMTVIKRIFIAGMFFMVSGETTRPSGMPAAAGEVRTSVYPPLTETCVTIVSNLDSAEPINIQKIPHCHVVTELEAHGIFQILNLPDGWTLKAGIGVESIHWTVAKVIFGRDTSIILSQDKPTERYCNWFGQSDPAPPAQNGQRGPDAAANPGLDGTNLVIDGIVEISYSSLWIDTSGGAGGDGGRGCEGQEGGRSTFDRSGISWQGAGGDGGAGGAGGNGGSMSKVDLLYRNGISVFARRPSCLAICGSASRSFAASGPNADILVYGAPGCGGVPGKGGFPGFGGIKQNGFSDLSAIGHMGPDSTTPGQRGLCMP
jgi:hypothetical protein